MQHTTALLLPHSLPTHPQSWALWALQGCSWDKEVVSAEQGGLHLCKFR